MLSSIALCARVTQRPLLSRCPGRHPPPTGHAALRAAAVGPVGAAVTAVVGAMGVTGAGGAPRAAVADPPAPALAAT